MSFDNLGDRMKGYEDAYRHAFLERMPIIIRLDGNHFHSYTKECQRPFDAKLTETMNETALYLCKNVQNAVLAYTQSDEISLLLINYKELNSQSWFNNNIQKMVSVAASMAGAIFTFNSWRIWMGGVMAPVGLESIRPAMFDARAFVLPKEEVNNYFLWRQQDNTRNSVQMLARSLYSHKECEDKNNSALQEMCFQKGQNWNDLPTAQKRGRCIVKEKYMKDDVERSRWIVDNEIPIFSANKDYINKEVFLPIGE